MTRNDRIEELEAQLAAMTAELHMMKTAGVIEVAVRNPSVFEYMVHWEDRAETYRADLPATDAQAMANPKVKALVEAIKTSRALTVEAAKEGFNYKVGDWVERMYEHNGNLSAALAALETDT